MDEIRCPKCGREAFIELIFPEEMGEDDRYIQSYRCLTCGWRSSNPNDLIKDNYIEELTQW